MPCDTRYQYTAVDLNKLPDRDRLARTLTADGWRVTYNSATRELDANDGRLQLRIDATGATLRTSQYSADAASAALAIGRSYAIATVKEVSRRFGFKDLGETQLQDGATRIALRR